MDIQQNTLPKFDELDESLMRKINKRVGKFRGNRGEGGFDCIAVSNVDQFDVMTKEMLRDTGKSAGIHPSRFILMGNPLTEKQMQMRERLRKKLAEKNAKK